MSQLRLTVGYADYIFTEMEYMMLEDTLSNTNYKIMKELRRRISEVPDINEIVEEGQVRYQYSGEEFFIIKTKKDYLKIDFKSDKRIEDPMEFSWKIKPTKKQKFDRRMQLKNISDIDIAFGLIFQSYNTVKAAYENNKPVLN